MFAASVEATQAALVIHLQDGKVISIPWESCSTKLAKADAAQRQYTELSPGGYGVHWPLLDEDLSIQGLYNSQHP